MTYWHWGVNFNNHPESHYTFMLNNKILIGSLPDVDYQVGDIVGVHKGQGLLAIAMVTGPNQPLPQTWDEIDLFHAYGIDPALNPIYAPATFKKVFPVMRGAGKIQNQIRQQVIHQIWNLL